LLDGVNDLQKDNIHMIIAPNPVETQAMITIAGMDKNSFGTYVLNDISGRELSRIKITSNPFIFNRSKLASGIYILSVTNRQGIIVSREKLIVK